MARPNIIEEDELLDRLLDTVADQQEGGATGPQVRLHVCIGPTRKRSATLLDNCQPSGEVGA
ncbi:hypothetical protein Mkiyose1665_24690 [Mycobacterium kiyosense]|uniref:Uncharacterized protein n=1 Tax=Mycobacterium kiyosense TaxID=2871094 RepID=A0A9P3UX23_9MYCO|nr:hypothetical protein SRL2020028_10400 [Mycobacterium kiyosense]GLB90352.1 hypothetical protein SRL2020130_31690 [Mycobacterium kiyosense]GLB96059.1 hypothetical protein SRL2020226_28350 [Mycobacterium kiyosense]GLC08678.1 hypothetical protein SRL2020411_33240 [Mycobacterium kiyosense]GLC14722.1 hypothetical protein SRL2020448_33250 [Mycobacterium kiyosense]